MPLTTLKDRVRAATSSQRQTSAPPPVQDETADVSSAQDSAVEGWLRRYEGHVTDALPAGVEPGLFLAAVRAALPGLRSCTPASVLQATLAAARFGLVPDGREAVISNEFGRAVFIPTYRGYIALMHRSGQVASVRVGMVHEGDEYAIEPSAPPPLDFTHRTDPVRSKAGRPLFAYAFAWFTSGSRSQVVTVTREQAEEIRDEYSRAYVEAEVSGARDSVWHRDFDAMWWKTAARRLEKVVPLSAEVRALVAADRAGEEGRVQILHAPDPEADAAGRASEASQEAGPAVLPRKRSRRQPRRTSRAARRGRAGRRS